MSDFNIVNLQDLKELREQAYGMSVANLNPRYVEQYMKIASACAVLESMSDVDCSGSDAPESGPDGNG